MTAPFAGVIVHQEAVIGELERTDHPAITVADVSRMWVWISVRKEDAGRIVLGQPVEVQVEGRSMVTFGRVAWVNTEVDPKTRTVQVRADVVNPYHAAVPHPRVMAAVGRGGPGPEAEPAPLPDLAAQRDLMANMFGSARVRVARLENALLVPDKAIQAFETKQGGIENVVFVAGPDGLTFEPRQVRLGRAADGMTVVFDGLAPGEKVVVAGSYVLKSELIKDRLSN
jgi:cobalt-zinc-cadmium efflux system membrane fusion protein